MTECVYVDFYNLIKIRKYWELEADGVPEIEAYMQEVLPDPEAEKRFKEELRLNEKLSSSK